jgi:uncharacterized protein (TIGR02646 family)
MRFVDIERLDPPLEWQARADRALNELRDEVTLAAAEALAAGLDPSAARRTAVTRGLDVAARKQIWGDLKPKLAALKNGQCWYSESRNPTADKNVDHFRPKSRVHEDPAHEGYWWLAFTWRNYRYSSQWCNQRRIDDACGTDGGKWDHFPLLPGGFRARQEGDDHELEEPDLLDPTDPDDWRLLTFRTDGHPTPAKQAGTREHCRATTSIHMYHLDCKELVDDRRLVAGMVQRIVQDLERLLPQIADPRSRVLFKSCEVELLRAIHEDAEYSAAALAYARAEVYTQRAGQPFKRDWLERILHSRP